MDLENSKNDIFGKFLSQTLTKQYKEIFKIYILNEDFFENIPKIFPKNNPLIGQQWLLVT
jgi:hypothetical protein